MTIAAVRDSGEARWASSSSSSTSFPLWTSPPTSPSRRARTARRNRGRFHGWPDALGLQSQLRKYPEQLSGGQQQRVAIARALAARPKLILADEPTGNLDEATADEVMEQFLALVAETGAALLMVTHSPRLAARLGRQAHLSQGRLA